MATGILSYRFVINKKVDYANFMKYLDAKELMNEDVTLDEGTTGTLILIVTVEPEPWFAYLHLYSVRRENDTNKEGSVGGEAR